MKKERDMNIKIASVDIKPSGQARRRYAVKPRVYVWPRGESIIDNLMNRRSRPIKLFRQAAKDGLSAMGVDLSKVELRWSQKAGCSCGCSPGFIVEGFDSKLYRNDVHIDVEAA